MRLAIFGRSSLPTRLKQGPRQDAIRDSALAKSRHAPPGRSRLERQASPIVNLYSPMRLTRRSLAEGAKVADTIEGLAVTAEAAVKGFEARMAVQPIGQLHLERIQMNPVGVERGALLYSVPLTPGETVNLTHKEWSVRSEEFEKIVQDTLEEVQRRRRDGEKRRRPSCRVSDSARYGSECGSLTFCELLLGYAHDELRLQPAGLRRGITQAERRSFGADDPQGEFPHAKITRSASK